MKRGTPDHWKMKQLARALKIPSQYAIPVANGIMERLWHYTARLHPRGDIGGSPDWAIAEACAWDCRRRADRPGHDDGKAAAFVAALVVAGWLDSDIAVTSGGSGPAFQCRLLVHDWHQHADESTKKVLKNKGLPFLIPSTRTEDSGLPKPLPLPKPKPKPLPEPPANAENISPEEFNSAWERHAKHSGRETQQLVLQRILAMNGKFNVDRFRERHGPYCEYWALHGWNFCSLTFLGWIENGMPDPPQEAGIKRVDPMMAALAERFGRQ